MELLLSRQNLFKLIQRADEVRPVNKVFLTDLMVAIENRDAERRRKPSKWYKPSSFICLRQMYYMRIEQEPDATKNQYTNVGMADTGSRRHEAIQEVLIDMEKMGFDWRYIDVADYIKAEQAEGRLLNLQVLGKRGAETKLFDTVLQMSFMCDGIIQQISTGKYFLFEFKNQVSFKVNGKVGVDEEHIPQVSSYGLALNLDASFVVYENRDVCELSCPELFAITPEMKQAVTDKIFTCEGYVERLIPPPMHSDSKPCRYCDYKISCKKAGK